MEHGFFLYIETTYFVLILMKLVLTVCDICCCYVWGLERTRRTTFKVKGKCQNKNKIINAKTKFEIKFVFVWMIQLTHEHNTLMYKSIKSNCLIIIVFKSFFIFWFAGNCNIRININNNKHIDQSRWKIE